MTALRMLLLGLIVGACGSRRPLQTGELYATRFLRPLPPLAKLSEAELHRQITFRSPPSVTSLSAVEFALPSDYELGQQAWGTEGVCVRASDSVNAQRWFGSDVDLTMVFARAMQQHGYRTGTAGDLQVVAKVTSAVCNFCLPNVTTDARNVFGDAYLRVAWAVIAAPDRRVLFAGATEGTTYTTIKGDVAGLIQAAFGDAAHRLALSDGYQAAVAGRPLQPKVAAR
jgi:hypothetical protein